MLVTPPTTAAMLKATSLRRLPVALLLALAGGLLRAAGLILTLRPAGAVQVLGAWGWNVKELPVTMVHRQRLQRRRKVDDTMLDALRTGSMRIATFPRFRSFLVKYVDQLTTARSPEDEDKLRRWS
jgi:hypothetical protein